VDGALLEEDLGVLEADDGGPLDGPHSQAWPPYHLRNIPSTTSTTVRE
jgi:hypothetical protein